MYARSYGVPGDNNYPTKKSRCKKGTLQHAQALRPLGQAVPENIWDTEGLPKQNIPFIPA